MQSIINNKNATAAQLAEARRLIAELKGNIETYTAQIEELKTQNTQLTQEKQQVTEERDVAIRIMIQPTRLLNKKKM